MNAGDETAGTDQPDPEPGARRRRRITRTAPLAAVAALAAAALVLGGLALTQTGQRGPSRIEVALAAAQAEVLAPGATISVTGSGTVQGTPDEASFTVGIDTTAATATGALARNNSQVSSLEATLRHEGVTSAEMQTSSLQINADTNRYGTITGFSVDDDLNVDMADVDAAGAAIDAAAEAVGNGIQLYGISFSLSNKSALLAQARAAAMRNARTEAAQVAAGARLTLGPVAKVTDQENAGSTIPYNDLTFAGAAVTNSAEVPVEAGTQPVSVQVSVEYQLRS